MSKIYSIKDKLTGKFIKDSNLHNYDESYTVLLCNTPTELYFESKEAAKARLKKIIKKMHQELPEWSDDVLTEVMKPDPSRFIIVEAEVKASKDFKVGYYYRIKNTQNNEYYKTTKKTSSVGKIYRTLSGAERMATILTKTPKNKRDTKAKKLLFGKPECANVELEACSVEYKE